jgi:2-dehydro-3-deoxyphosphogluconate aldolase/(4S)-4-hydroxy-2-oxoglutarate aldolase
MKHVVGPADPADVVNELASVRTLAIVRHRQGGNTLGALRAMAAGGVTIAELTVQTPGWQDVVASAVADGMTAGAGTVTTRAELADARAAGARFVVSPGFDPDVVSLALDWGIEPLPGVATGSEILAAQRAGARLFKLFPAGALGLEYFRQLRGPFPDLAFVPTGGIEIGAMDVWLEAGAFAVALGSDLAGRQAPHTEAELAALTRRAEAAAGAGRQAGPAPTDHFVTTTTKAGS